MFFLKGILDFLTIWFRRPKFLAMCGVILFCAYTIISVYGVRVVTDIPVYVVDHDNSTISRTIRLFLDSGPDLQVLGSLENLEDAEALLMEGKIGGIIYIPNGLSQSVKTQNGGHIITYVDGTNMLMAKNVDKAVQTVVKTTSVGVSMIAIQKQGMPKHALMGALQPISLDVERPFNALTLYSEYLLPVLIFFCLNIFTCIMTCACYQEKVPAKIATHQIRRRFFYLGRLAVVFIAALIIGIIIYQKGLPRIDIVIQSAPIMALSSLVIYLFLTICLFSIIYIILPDALAMSLCYLTCMLSVMFSGLTWPLEMMPWYIQEFASWIPMTPFLQSVQVFLYHDANWSDLWLFYQMFVKQLILFICVIFVTMRIKDLKLIVLWIIHKLKREDTIPEELEVAASHASQKLSAILLDKEREAIRSSQMLRAIESQHAQTNTSASSDSSSNPHSNTSNENIISSENDSTRDDSNIEISTESAHVESIEEEAERIQRESGLPVDIVRNDSVEFNAAKDLSNDQPDEATRLNEKAADIDRSDDAQIEENSDLSDMNEVNDDVLSSPEADDANAHDSTETANDISDDKGISDSQSDNANENSTEASNCHTNEVK